MTPYMEYLGRSCRVLMGAGTAGRVAEEVRRLGGTRAMVLMGARTSQTRLAAQVLESLGPLVAATFAKVVEHSRVTIVEEAAGVAKATGIDVLVAVGGGSASDTAKAVAILLAEGAPLARHANRFTPPDKFVQQDLKEPKLPILAVPTTASAAEVTPGLGVKGPDGHKLLFWDDKVAARTVILDPEANLEVPAGLMATSGMNALAHCIEGLYSKKRNPIAEGLALQGIRLLGRGLPEVVRDPKSEKARAQVLFGAHISGMVIASTRTCIHHGLCHVLGAPGGLPHGVANSIMLPHTMRYVAPVAAPQLRLAAEAFGVATDGLSDSLAADRAIAAVQRIQQLLGVPTRLRDTTISREMLPIVAEHAMGDRALHFSPGPMATRSDVLGVLEAAW